MNITILLVIMTAIISYQALNNPVLQQKLLFYPYDIHTKGEWYRFISGGLVHADYAHLIINMVVLYQFGEVVEYYFGAIFGSGLGRLIYILFYFSAVAIASTPSYLMHKENAYYRALGASGATSALVFVFILFNPWQMFLFPPLPAIIFGIGYLIYSSYMAKRGSDNIGHDAHFWGAAYGLAFIISIALLYKKELLDLFINQLLAGPSFG